MSRKAPAIGSIAAAINKLLGYIVAVPRPLLLGMNGPQPLSSFIEHNASEEMWLRLVGGASPGRCLIGEKLLHSLEEVDRNDRLMLAIIDLIAMPDMADIDWVREQVIEVAAGKGMGDLDLAIAAP